jgi:myosin heavy subunit
MSQIRIHPIGDHVYVRDVQYEWLPAIVEDVKEHEVLVRITLPNDWVKTTIRRNGSKAEEIDNGDGDNSHNKFDNKNIDHHKVVDVIDGEKRWVKLAEYFNHHLPLQNWDEDDTTTSATKGSNDMSQLRHINEAELLYQIKKRYCSLDQPYTRITTLTANSSNIAKTTNMMVMVAVNPCRYIPSLYTIEKQRYYIQYYMEQQQQQQQQKELPRPSSPFVTTDGTSHWTFAFRMQQHFFLRTHCTHFLSPLLSFHPSETEDIHAPSFDEKKEEDDDLHLTTTSSRCAFAPVSTFVSDRAECEPHIYEISSLAYHSLITTQTNQAIIVSGESGSGKTESIKIVMKHLASSTPVVSAPQQSKQYQQVMGNCSDNDLVSLLLASSPIFESFGNAKTFSNSNSSRFGKVTKLHYLASSLSNGTGMEISNTESKIGLIGSSFQTYMLEANRVVSHVEGERNYHIFYQMLAAPAPVKNELLGSDWREATPNDFRYLNRYNCGIEESSIDATNWTQTLKALIIFGWDGESLERLIRALGIVLLIGNIEFEGSDDNKASIEQTADLIMLSTSLGIHAAELELALTQRMIQTTHDLVLVPFTPEQANEACEALSKTIYIRIFDAIVRQINCFTFRPNGDEFEETKTIALVDIFGFETFEVNRFEQFCINYANERLQQKYILDSLSHHQMDCQEEGITIPEWKNIDNTSIVELFECVPGLIQSLNDQCRLPNGSSEVRLFLLCSTTGRINYCNTYVVSFFDS